MAKKKKKLIIHLSSFSSKATFCGLDNEKFRSYPLFKNEKHIPDIKLIDSSYCHKCKHTHKLNLAKVKK